MNILIVVQLLSHLFLAANACTEIRVKAEDNSVVVARTMEFMVSLKSDIIVEPKGYSFTATLPEKCDRHLTPLTWQHKYTVAYLNAFEMPIGSDGMNSAGLSVGSLLFTGFAKFQNVSEDKCGMAISQLEFALWLLGNFATVKELREALNKTESFPLVFDKKLGKQHTFELHYSVIDKTGEGIIIEFTDQGRKVHENTVGVMTNSPPYDFHMLNLRNYVHLSKYAHGELVLGEAHFNATGQGSGLLGMPGDLTPPSRLVRAASLANFAAQAKTSDEAVNLAFHVLNSVDIPVGVASQSNEEQLTDYTSWVVAKDLTNNALYFRDYNDLTIRVVNLDKVQAGQRLKQKVESTEVGGFKDVTDEFKLAEMHTEL